ncbi:Nif3-like dinuclear metal center hexameric protein [Gilliamella sp. App6-5]|jgi:dinuclear metal center YbgI/SA1388 family protein|uniref:Nif3-like dinuclear metal center hexameric protein n=1 Tax=Gilliamella sp. App6-5 TaxID=3120232 RepID=UPI00080DAC22|nr:Nif3-like dinuclear metal center hexameric protein [Gilliamella apicola]OCG16019.1 Nif3-like dinuclear metal center hexameric protein [Gilliamella apicola]
MQNFELEKIINNELQITRYRDYAPNGLQVQGRAQVNKIVTGVTACQLLLDKAVELQADAVLVHHGYFWKNEVQTITGIKYQRLKTLLTNDINLYGYHLPLDGHPIFGNNIELANLLGISVDKRNDITDLLFTGTLRSPLTALQFKLQLEQVLHNNKRQVLFCGDNAPEVINRIAWCSGGGQDYIEQAAQMGVDAFFTGEVSERTIHLAREYGINFYAAGHHATERYGIRKLGEWLASCYGVEVIFVDIDNPA